MTRGELDYAIRLALNNFDKWIDCTGVLCKGASWYYEAQGCIEDAVKIGSKIACEGMNADLSNIIEPDIEDKDDGFKDFNEFLRNRRLTGHT